MKYSKEVVDKLIKALEDGLGRVNACKKAKICYDTFLDWMVKKAEFPELVKKAEELGNNKIKEICQLRIISSETWQSAAWWLERKYPKEFGKSIQIHSEKGELAKAIEQIALND